MDSKSNILDNGVLFSIKIYNWNASVKIDPKQINENVPSEIVRAMQDLFCDKTLIKELKKIKNQVFYKIETYAMPFPLENIFFVPHKYLEKIDEYLEEMKFHYFNLVDELIRNYDKLRNDFKEKYPDNYKIVKKRYPDASQLKNKFRFEWNLYSISIPDANDGFKMIDKSIIEKEKAKFQNLMVDMEKQTIELIRDKLIDRINVLAEQCNNGTINRATMGSVTNIIEQWEEIWQNCLDQKTLGNAIKSVKMTLNKVGNVDAFKENEKLQGQVEEKLEKIVSRLKKVEFKRKIKM